MMRDRTALNNQVGGCGVHREPREDRVPHGGQRTANGADLASWLV